MLAQDIMAAVRDGDINTIRDAFRRLVDFPHEGEIVAAGPGQLVGCLHAVCKALFSDEATMPAGTCDALEVPRGRSYGWGAQVALMDAQELAAHYKACHTKRRSAA